MNAKPRFLHVVFSLIECTENCASAITPIAAGIDVNPVNLDPTLTAAQPPLTNIHIADLRVEVECDAWAAKTIAKSRLATKMGSSEITLL